MYHRFHHVIFCFCLWGRFVDIVCSADEALRYVAQIEPCVVRINELSHIPATQNHLVFVREIIREMSKELKTAACCLRESSDSPEAECREILCTGSLLCFFQNEGQTAGNPFVITPDRGYDQIFIKGFPFSSVKRSVFCPGDQVSHYKQANITRRKEILKQMISQLEVDDPDLGTQPRQKSDDQIKELLELEKEYNEWHDTLSNRAKYMVDSVKKDELFKNVLTCVVCCKEEEYTRDHLHDGEGYLVDALIRALRRETQSRSFANIDIIYPVFCVDRDPCRLCLRTIQDYLYDNLKNILGKGVKVCPIVFGKEILDERPKEAKIRSSKKASSMPESVAAEASPLGETSLERVDGVDKESCGAGSTQSGKKDSVKKAKQDVVKKTVSQATVAVDTSGLRPSKEEVARVVNKDGMPVLESAVDTARSGLSAISKEGERLFDFAKKRKLLALRYYYRGHCCKDWV